MVSGSEGVGRRYLFVKTGAGQDKGSQSSEQTASKEAAPDRGLLLAET